MDQTGDTITINLKDAFVKRYALRPHSKAPNWRSVQTLLPVEVIEREARRRGLTSDEFIKTHDLEYVYDGFGMYCRFVPKVSLSRSAILA